MRFFAFPCIRPAHAKKYFPLAIRLLCISCTILLFILHKRDSRQSHYRKPFYWLFMFGYDTFPHIFDVILHDSTLHMLTTYMHKIRVFCIFMQYSTLFMHKRLFCFCVLKSCQQLFFRIISVFHGLPQNNFRKWPFLKALQWADYTYYAVWKPLVMQGVC